MEFIISGCCGATPLKYTMKGQLRDRQGGAAARSNDVAILRPGSWLPKLQAAEMLAGEGISML